MNYDAHIKSLEQKHGVKIEILMATDVENPRNWGTESSLVTALRRHHIIGDKRVSNDAELPEGYSSILDAFIQHLKEKQLTINDVTYLPVYAYIHSGMTIATTPYNCRFDSGQAGYIYLSNKQAREQLGVKRLSRANKDAIHQQLIDEIALLDSYICDEVYTFTIDGEYPDEAGDFYGADIKESGLIENLELALSCLAEPA